MPIDDAGIDSGAPESVSPPAPSRKPLTASERLAMPFTPTPAKKEKTRKRTAVEKRMDRYRALEAISEAEGDEDKHPIERLPVDLASPKLAVQNAFVNELTRRVKRGNRWETKFIRLVRQITNQGLLGDKDSQKLIFENVRGRLPVAESEAQAQTINILNKIPAPREPKPLLTLPAEEVKVAQVSDVLDVQSEPVPSPVPPESSEI